MTELDERAIARKIKVAENKIRKDQLDEICKQIDEIDCNPAFDDDPEATIRLEALKRVKKSHLASWWQMRNEAGWSNDAWSNDALVGA